MHLTGEKQVDFYYTEGERQEMECVQCEFIIHQNATTIYGNLLTADQLETCQGVVVYSPWE